MKTITKDFEARTAYESPSILVVEMKTATVLCGSYNDYGLRDIQGDDDVIDDENMSEEDNYDDDYTDDIDADLIDDDYADLTIVDDEELEDEN